MIYTLSKTKLKAGQSSSVRTGSTASAKRVRVMREVDPTERREGDEVYVAGELGNFIKTSPITSVTPLDDVRYTLETRTSEYLLEETDNE